MFLVNIVLFTLALTLLFLLTSHMKAYIFLELELECGCRSIVSTLAGLPATMILQQLMDHDKRRAKRFLGIPYIADVAKPIYKVTRKAFDFVWNEAQEKAFQQLEQYVHLYSTLQTIEPVWRRFSRSQRLRKTQAAVFSVMLNKIQHKEKGDML
uniref:Uncharacterized protein n=1 Tax=Rousettus aegyptiacus TaxID=9407 RepID=A0A7J8DI81_ROUAE|nr:hypothetical protein HJG63_008621 [Rousettus aegyptiacus]